MTLVFRNRTLIIYIAVAVFLLAALAAGTITGYTHGFFDNLQPSTRLLAFFSYSTPAVIASICTMILYVALTGFTVFVMFEKTQSSEIIYFGLFLIACLFESLRFAILFFKSVGLYSNFALFASRGIFFGRICSALTFLAAAIFCGGKFEHDPERICSLILAAGIVCALLIPFNTGRETSNGMLTYGYMYRIFFVRVLFALTAFFVFFLNSITGEISEFRMTAYGFILLYAGYLLLTAADSFALFAAGTALLGSGTYLFLNSLHKYYLWK